MKKILFIALGLLMAVTSFGQDSLTTDSTQMIQGDTVSIHNAEFSGSKLEDATKAEGDSAYIRNDFASAIQIYESRFMNHFCVKVSRPMYIIILVIAIIK